MLLRSTKIILLSSVAILLGGCAGFGVGGVDFATSKSKTVVACKDKDSKFLKYATLNFDNRTTDDCEPENT